MVHLPIEINLCNNIEMCAYKTSDYHETVLPTLRPSIVVKKASQNVFMVIESYTIDINYNWKGK